MNPSLISTCLRILSTPCCLVRRLALVVEEEVAASNHQNEVLKVQLLTAEAAAVELSATVVATIQSPLSQLATPGAIREDRWKVMPAIQQEARMQTQVKTATRGPLESP